MRNEQPRRKTRNQILASMIFVPVDEIHALDSSTGDGIAVLMSMLREDHRLCFVSWPEDKISGLIRYPKRARMPLAENILSVYRLGMVRKYPNMPWLG